jgi:hypothetical protein
MVIMLASAPADEALGERLARVARAVAIQLDV